MWCQHFTKMTQCQKYRTHIRYIYIYIYIYICRKHLLCMKTRQPSKKRGHGVEKYPGNSLPSASSWLVVNGFRVWSLWNIHRHIRIIHLHSLMDIHIPFGSQTKSINRLQIIDHSYTSWRFFQILEFSLAMLDYQRLLS